MNLGWPKSLLDTMYSEATEMLRYSDTKIRQLSGNEFAIDGERHTYRVTTDESYLVFKCSCQTRDPTRKYYCEHGLAVSELVGGLKVLVIYQVLFYF